MDYLQTSVIEDRLIMEDFLEIKLNCKGKLNSLLIEQFFKKPRIKNTMIRDLDCILYNNVLAVINEDAEEDIEQIIVIDKPKAIWFFIDNVGDVCNVNIADELKKK